MSRVSVSDFNVTPDDLAQTGILNGGKGVIVAPVAPTIRYSDRTIDFFVVSPALAHTAASCFVGEGPITPHYPVGLSLGGKVPPQRLEAFAA